MATLTHGSFAESTVGTKKVFTTTALTALANGISRSDAYVTPSFSNAIGGKSIIAGISVSGAGDKGTAANAASTSFKLNEAAYTAATKVDAIDLASTANTSTARVTFTVPTGALGVGTACTIQLCNDTNGSTSAGDAVIGIGTNGASDGTIAETIVDAINGFNAGGGTYGHSRAHMGSGNTATGSGIPGVTASLGTGGTKVTLTAVAKGPIGNDIAIANAAGSIATAGNLAGGAVTTPSGAYIELESTDGTKIKYYPKATGASVYSNEFNLGISASDGAGKLVALIEDNDKGHKTSRFSITRSFETINITQVTAGAAGNTAIVFGGNFGEYVETNPEGMAFRLGADRKSVNFVLQTSIDGVNYSSEDNSTVIIADVDTGTTGTYIASLTKDQVPNAPFYRLGLNVDGAVNIAGGSNGFGVTQQFVFDTAASS